MELTIHRWHWWADVPVQPHGEIYALPTTTYQGEPSVRYRGLFINDEAPALTSWVHEKIGPKYNFDFYKRVFELLLRLKVSPVAALGHAERIVLNRVARQTSYGPQCGLDIRFRAAVSSPTTRETR